MQETMHLQYAVALRGSTPEIYFRTPRGIRETVVSSYTICVRSHEVQHLGHFGCREPDCCMVIEQGVTCEELRDLEVVYENDYFNHVPLGMLTSFRLQGYVFETSRSLLHY